MGWMDVRHALVQRRYEVARFWWIPTTNSLLRDDVLFVNKDDFTRDLLIEDMKNLYGDGIGIELVNTIGEDLRVYRFTLE